MSPLFHMLRLCVLRFSKRGAGESGSSRAEDLKRCDKLTVSSESNEHGMASSGSLVHTHHNFFRMRFSPVISEHLYRGPELHGGT